MAEKPRIVAELGRPETPGETAARKAASSQAYRSSKTVRNLVAALLVTVAIVAVIVFAVPRGAIPERPPIDVAAVADSVSSSLGREVLVPAVPESWRVNKATLEADDGQAWEIVYAPETGFVNIVQGFDADDAWASRQLSGAAASTTVTIDGVVWDVYEIADLERAGNVSHALSTTAGPDTVVVYGGGDIDADTVREGAAAVSTQIASINEEIR